MKKTFLLHQPGKADARVLDAIKHEIRKYVQRERRKTPPERFARWEFECRIGADKQTAELKPLKELSSTLDAIAQAGADSAYVEITATPLAQAPRR